jgi:hypothetical protein
MLKNVKILTTKAKGRRRDKISATLCAGNSESLTVDTKSV